MNRVLTVEENARLRLIGVERVANVALEVAGQTEQKSSQPRPTVLCWPLRSVVVEIELAGTVRIAGHTQVVRVANVRTELNTVLSADVRPVIHELVLMFAFRQWAIALIHV